MTKESLAKLIIETVDNYNNEPTIALENVKVLLDSLEPRNAEQFAKWGNKNDRSTVETCWV